LSIEFNEFFLEANKSNYAHAAQIGPDVALQSLKFKAGQE